MCLQTGWTLDYIRSLSIDDFEILYRVAKHEESRSHLREVIASCFPNGKESWRDKYYSGIYKESYPSPENSEKALSTEDLAKLLSGGSLG